jgi:hypothetical protein
MSRAEVAAAVLASAEADGVKVANLYHQFLGRDPDSFGLQVFSGALQAGMTNEQVLALILGSDEYFLRAQQVA